MRPTQPPPQGASATPPCTPRNLPWRKAPRPSRACGYQRQGCADCCRAGPGGGSCHQQLLLPWRWQGPQGSLNRCPEGLNIPPKPPTTPFVVPRPAGCTHLGLRKPDAALPASCRLYAMGSNPPSASLSDQDAGLRAECCASCTAWTWGAHVPLLQSAASMWRLPPGGRDPAGPCQPPPGLAHQRDHIWAIQTPSFLASGNLWCSIQDVGGLVAGGSAADSWIGRLLHFWTAHLKPGASTHTQQQNATVSRSQINLS